MQPPTCQGIKVETKEDALVILHAVATNLLRMVTRRLDTNERRAIRPGYVFVWEERGTASDSTGMGIERWTDSIQWGPSRVRDEFLYYQQRRPVASHADISSSDSDETRATPRVGPPLLKQTYSAWVRTRKGIRKWHMIAYFNQETLSHLYNVRHHPFYPALAAIRVPNGVYESARTTRSRRRSPRAPSSATRPSRAVTTERPPQRRPIATLPPWDSLSTILAPPRHAADEQALNSFPLHLSLC